LKRRREKLNNILTAKSEGSGSILKWNIKKKEWCDVFWNRLAQDRHKWRAVVTTVMNLLVS
jgi:hypothetical protein